MQGAPGRDDLRLVQYVMAKNSFLKEFLFFVKNMNLIKSYMVITGIKKVDIDPRLHWGLVTFRLKGTRGLLYTVKSGILILQLNTSNGSGTYHYSYSNPH